MTVQRLKRRAGGKSSSSRPRRHGDSLRRDIELLEDRLLPSWLLGEGGQPVVRFDDAEGHRVVLRLQGPGSGRVTLAGDARGHADIETLTLTGTNQKSRLLVKIEDDDGLSLRGFIDVGAGGLGKLEVDGVLSAGLRSQGPIGLLHATRIENATLSSAVGFRRLSVDGSIVGSTILAGLDTVDGVLCNGNDVVGLGTIGQLTIGGSLIGSSVAAGVAPGTDCQFGTTDDVAERNAGLSVIERVRVAREIRGGADPGRSFAIVAADLAPQVFRHGRRFTGAGNVRVIGPIAPPQSDAQPPAIVAALAHDTAPGGGSNTDRITSDPAVTGTVTDASPVSSFLAGFGDTPTFNVLGDLQANGTFSFDRARLAQINGGSLPDGAIQFRLQARDVHGNTSDAFDVLFTLNTTPPTAPAFDLAASSDTAPVGDSQTAEASVTLVGVTAPGMALELLSGQAVIAPGNSDGTTGAFRFDNVPLVLGANPFSVRATDLAGNQTAFSRTITRVSATAPVDPVLEWNHLAIETVRLDASPPPIATRSLAMVHAAIFDVVNAIEGTPGLYVAQAAAADSSAIAAVAAAAERVLAYLYPAQQASLDAALAVSLARVTDGAAETNGVALGVSVADAIIALRSNDGWDDFVDYLGGDQPGQWRATGPMFALPLLPQWASLDPFTMTSPS